MHYSAFFYCKIQVQRLHVEDLRFYPPNKLNQGFSRKKENCTERKIVARILSEVGEKRNLNKARLSIYTKLEPCVYCYNVLDSIRKKNEVSIYLLYREMILQIVEELQNVKELKGRINFSNLYYALDYKKTNGVVKDMQKQGKKFIVLVEDNSFVELNENPSRAWFYVNGNIYEHLSLEKEVEIIWETETEKANSDIPFRNSEKVTIL